MGFRCCPPVRKADEPARRTTRALTAREQQIVRAFLDAAGALQGSVDSAVIRQLISAGVETSLGSLDTGGFVSALQPMVDSIQAEVQAGGTVGVRELPPSVRGSYRFDARDPRAVAWAQSRAGALIQQVTDEQRDILRGVLARSVENGWTVQQTQQDLRQVIGLHDRWATAVTNARQKELDRLIKSGMSPDRAEQTANGFADRYRQRLLNARARNIARTEIITASNQGRWLSWAQGVEGGYIAPTATKQWTTGPLVTRSPSRIQVCPICAGLRGEEVPWDKPFSNGVMMPPAHPSCRCTSVLVPLSIEQVRDRLRSGQPADSGFDAEAFRAEIAPEQERIRDLLKVGVVGGDVAGENVDLATSTGRGFTVTARGREANERIASVGRRARLEAERRDPALARLRADVDVRQRALDDARAARDLAKMEMDRIESRLLDEASERVYGKKYYQLRTITEQSKIRRTFDRTNVEWAEARARHGTHVAKVNETQNSLLRAVGEHTRARREPLLQVLKEVRPTGIADDLRFATRARSGTSLKVQQALQEATDVIPRDWTEAIGQSRTLIHKSTDRGFVKDIASVRGGRMAEISLSKSGRWAVPSSDNPFYTAATHELMHLVEIAKPEIRAAQHAFYWQRCAGESTVSLTGRELARRDEWHVLYAGRDYSAERGGAAAKGDNFEVLSVGFETLFGGYVSPTGAVMDDDYIDWVLGLLLTV